LLWDSTGVKFHTTTYDPFFVGSAWPLVADGRGGALLVWIEQGVGMKIMLKQISGAGILGDTTSAAIETPFEAVPLDFT